MCLDVCDHVDDGLMLHQSLSVCPSVLRCYILFYFDCSISYILFINFSFYQTAPQSAYKIK